MPNRRTVEIHVESVEFLRAGGRRYAESLHTISAALLWPRQGIARKVSVADRRFDGNRFAPDQSAWVETILFKEVVQGMFGLEVAVSPRVSDRARAFSSHFGGAVLSVMSDAVEGVVAGPAGRIAAAPIEYLARDVASRSKRPPAPIALGAVSCAAPDAGASSAVSVEIALLAPRPIETTRMTRRQGRPRRERKVLLEEGAPNGMAVLRIVTTP